MKQRRVSLSIVEDTIARASKLRPDQRQALITPMVRAWENLRKGTDAEMAWCSVADALNVAEVLAEMGIASNHEDTVERAQRSMAAIYQRRQDKGSTALYAEEISQIDLALWLHEVQLAECSQGELEKAIQTVKNRISAALKGAAPKDAIVCVGGLR